MLNLKEINKYYPASLRIHKQFIFKEYLQYLILQVIFSSKYSNKLSFLWWTNLRLIHNNNRFSEDLDFDNFGLSKWEFEDISKEIKKKLELQWFIVEVRNVYKWAFRCYIKIPQILKKLWFSSLSEEKILIQIDTVPHWFKYNPDKPILNKFGLFFKINTTPLDILLSQKIWAIFNKKRKKWRDFFDIIFLIWLTKPNIPYLKSKLWFQNIEETKVKILKLCKKIDFKKLVNDVKPFLINTEEINRVLMFEEYIKKALEI